MNDWLRAFLVFLLIVSPLRSEEIGPSQDELNRHRFSAPHLGTTVHLIFYSKEPREDAASLARSCFRKVRELDAVFSDYRADSEVRVLCQKPIKTAHAVSLDLFKVIAFAQTVSAHSKGAFDITLGKDTQRWRENSKKGKGPAKPDAKGSETPPSYRDLKLDPAAQSIALARPLKLDLGGVAKGYIADQLMVLLKKSGVKQAAVIIGGETVLAEAPPGKDGWRIGLENPDHEIIGKLVLANTALSTSGDSYQFFEIEGKRQAHLIDPATREGKSNRLNVTTLAPTAMQADAWATALRILSTDEALELASQQSGLEALFIPLGKKPLETDNFPERANK